MVSLIRVSKKPLNPKPYTVLLTFEGESGSLGGIGKNLDPKTCRFEESTL